jgi:hypothetical protein
MEGAVVILLFSTHAQAKWKQAIKMPFPQYIMKYLMGLIALPLLLSKAPGSVDQRDRVALVNHLLL